LPSKFEFLTTGVKYANQDHSSLQAGLYQPYLHLSVDHPALVDAGIDPLDRMKDGAREVAISVRDVMTNKKSDAIPTWL
jgi:hypothetical protein